MGDITVQDVRDWLQRQETKLFFGYVEAQKNEWERTVHSLLRDYGGDAIEAYKANVAADTLSDVMEIPEFHMIADIKEEDET